MMKKRDYYTFYDSWQLRELQIEPGQKFVAQIDLDDLKKGNVVTFTGFDDVDNHFGIFVFTDTDNNVLEVRGDFSGPASLQKLKMALSKA